MRERPMHLKNIPFGVTDWETVPAESYPGDAGHAIWRTQHFGDIRVRLVDCSPGMSQIIGALRDTLYFV